MAQIDYEKAKDIVPQNWIIDYLKMYKRAEKAILFIEKTIKTIKTIKKTGKWN